MVISTGSAPKALVPSVQPNVDTNSPSEPLADVVNKFIGKPRKPPKIKKRAFGASSPGAAFRK